MSSSPPPTPVLRSSIQKPELCARILAHLAELVAAMCPSGSGGLRSGPAANPEWCPGFECLKRGEVAEGIEMLLACMAHWSDTAARRIRAARHLEAAAQILIARAVQTCSTFISLLHAAPLAPTFDARTLAEFANGRWITAECPARLDLAGGWSGIPYFWHRFAHFTLYMWVTDKIPRTENLPQNHPN